MVDSGKEEDTSEVTCTRVAEQGLLTSTWEKKDDNSHLRFDSGVRCHGYQSDLVTFARFSGICYMKSRLKQHFREKFKW